MQVKGGFKRSQYVIRGETLTLQFRCRILITDYELQFKICLVKHCFFLFFLGTQDIRDSGALHGNHRRNIFYQCNCLQPRPRSKWSGLLRWRYHWPRACRNFRNCCAKCYHPTASVERFENKWFVCTKSKPRNCEARRCPSRLHVRTFGGYYYDNIVAMTMCVSQDKMKVAAFTSARNRLANLCNRSYI